jgi:hypothetical protein
MVTEIPKYENVKTRLCKERQKVLGNETNTEDSSKIVFSEEVLRLANNSSFIYVRREPTNTLILCCIYTIQ